MTTKLTLVLLKSFGEMHEMQRTANASPFLIVDKMIAVAAQIKEPLATLLDWSFHCRNASYVNVSGAGNDEFI